MTTKADHESVRLEGKRFRTTTLEVRYVASLRASDAPPRVGLIVPRHKRSAVARNRLKRRLRELVRLALLPDLHSFAPIDAVIRASPDAYGVDHASLAGEVARIGAWLIGRAAPRAAPRAEPRAVPGA